MRLRSCAFIAIGALTWICAASASSVRIVVRPASPVAGAKAALEVHARLKAPVYATLRSPRNASRKVRLRHTGKAVWQAAITFPYSGLWTVRAQGASKEVIVSAQLAPPKFPASTFVPLGKPGCIPASPANIDGGEARGVATRGDLWAVGFSPILAETHQAVLEGVVGKKTKILWRMLGSGDATFTAIGPDGTRVAPTDGPLRHDWSTWNRPGNEWGSIFVFTQPGCWQMHAERTDNAGDLWILVRS